MSGEGRSVEDHIRIESTQEGLENRITHVRPRE
jgi:hypothetical protein